MYKYDMLLSIFQRVKYHATDKTKTVNNTLFRDMKGRIAGGSTDVWKDVKMLIPPVPPSYLLGCNIIDIKYIAMVSVLVPQSPDTQSLARDTP